MWSSRLTFILAAVGSAVGLGNAWRFPGLAAKHGGGTFLVVYLLAMLLMGIPLLMMEISIARKFRRGAIESMRGIGKKWEFVGWAATSNAFVIVCYYSVVFAWVILMFVNSWQFAGMTADNEAASTLFLNLTQTTAAIDGGNIPGIVLVCLLIAWGLIFYCIRNGAKSVGKVVKFTVFAPVVLLLIMAVKGCTMEGAMDGIKMLFVPDVNAFSDPTLWVDAIGQVFYSLSIMMAIMFAYGSYVGDDADIAADAMIIAFGDITASGIGTAFFVYPTAIVNLTNIGWLNAAFGAIFYLMLITLAIDSAFSIVEGISAAISDKFHLKPKTVSGLISLVFITQAGLAWLDIVDNWTNQINLILIGILECIAIGWTFNLRKVLTEVNRNAKRFKMPFAWFAASIKFISPLLLAGLFVWNMITLFSTEGGYGGYPIWAQIVAGWAVSVLVFISGFIAKGVIAKMKKKGYTEDEIVWKDLIKKQVLDKYLYAHSYEHYAADKLRLRLVLRAEHVADLHADRREYKCRRAYHRHRGHYRNVEEGEGHAHSERVYARCHRERQHRLWREGVVEVLLLVLDRLAYHVRADEHQKREGYPVVNALYKALELPAQQPADNGHKRLKAAEVQSANEIVTGLQPSYRQTLADRHGEGVHRQSHRDYE